MSALRDEKRKRGGAEPDTERLNGTKQIRRDDNSRDEERDCSHTSSSYKPSCDSYTIGWICALHIEMAAARSMLDEIHDGLPQSPNDSNTYTLGRIGQHNIAIACLPEDGYGTNNAATVASNMSWTFPCLSTRLLVGVGGGVPGKDNAVRLGDVVVGTRVLQYDLGKTLPNGFLCTGNPRRAPPVLMTAIAKLRADHEIEPSKIPSILSEMLQRHPHMIEYASCGQLQDRLFDSAYDHLESNDHCDACEKSQLVSRSLRSESMPMVHYGGVASGNQVMRHGIIRDQVAAKYGIICFEMEGAGLMDNYPCLVIRGICDYADSHKNKKWQKYAAATASAYARELLTIIPVQKFQLALQDTVSVRAGGGKPSSLERRKSMLDSLNFEQMDSRHSSIQAAHSQTCEWLLKHPEYIDWKDPDKLEQHHGFLWISGKPGAGKSTLMKFAYSQTKRKLRKDAAVIAFFFNARGGDFEKSTSGMYRSLLFQLLIALPDLQEVLDPVDYSQKDEVSDIEWGIELLRELFSQAIFKLGARSLTCFVDALDECDETQVRSMVSFFEDLGQAAIQDRTSLYICFSSRHYPHIDIQNGRRLTLEHQNGHEQDLQKYLQSNLKAGNSKSVREIKDQILLKAAGVFMWVVLVVNILNKEFQRGRLFAVKKRIQELPEGLSGLFRDILTRDQENMEDLKLCLQWLLFANRPLTREEFYFAVVAGLDTNPGSLIAWDSDFIDEDSMNLFILSSSKGLAEMTRNGNPIVQFIHESVRDFLLKDNGLQVLWPEMGQDFEILSHDRLKQCCQTYAHIDISNYIFNSGAASEANSADATILANKWSTSFPFLKYAIRNVLHHANAAAAGISQETFLSDFDLSNWIKVRNLFERFKSHRYTQNASLLYILADANLARLISLARRYSPTTEIRGERHRFPLLAALVNGHQDAVSALLSPERMDQEGVQAFASVGDGWDSTSRKDQERIAWAAARGYMPIIRLLLQTGLDVNQRNGHDTFPLSIAAANGQLATVEFLLQSGASTKAYSTNSRHHHTALSLAAKNGHASVVGVLLKHAASIYGHSTAIRPPLSYAAENGHESVVRTLLQHRASATDYRFVVRSPLSYAAENGHESIVSQLLEHYTTDQIRHTSEKEVLCHAARNGHGNIVRMLLQRSASVDYVHTPEGLPLCEAAKNGHEAVVELLIQHGAEIEKHPMGTLSALSSAVLQGHESVVRSLLHHGADPNARSQSEFPIQLAVNSGNRAILKLLLEHGAKMRDSLHHAVESGREDVVRLLFEQGAKPDTVDGEGYSPLCLAAKLGLENITQVLLENGADVEGGPAESGTPLLIAARHGHEAVARRLLENGARIRGGEFREAINQGHESVTRLLLENGDGLEACHGGNSLLTLAIVKRHEAIIRLLLEKCADIDFGPAESPPLICAVEIGHEPTIRLLLHNGANVEARDWRDRTPLLAAVEVGDKAIIRLLLENGSDINAPSGSKRTALQMAAKDGNVAIARLLTDKGAALECEDDNSLTPLQLAAINGHLGVARVLLERGANVMAGKEAGNTPLELATRKAHVRLIQLFEAATLHHGLSI